MNQLRHEISIVHYFGIKQKLEEYFRICILTKYVPFFIALLDLISDFVGKHKNNGKPMNRQRERLTCLGRVSRAKELAKKCGAYRLTFPRIILIAGFAVSRFFVASDRDTLPKKSEPARRLTNEEKLIMTG